MKKIIVSIILTSLLFTTSTVTVDAVNCLSSMDTDDFHMGISEFDDDFVSDFFYVYAGENIITYTYQPTSFEAYAMCPNVDKVEYAWDFDGDGIYDSFSLGYSGKRIQTSYIYSDPGNYTVTLKAMDPYGEIPASYDYVKVIVKDGDGDQEYFSENDYEDEYIERPIETAADGVTEKYAVMINGAGATRFWIDVNFTYNVLTEDYGYTADNIYLLNYNGFNPDGENPDNMIDYPATHSNIVQVIYLLAGIIDGDDLLLLWIDDHGMGYFGPGTSNYGFLYGYDAPFVDPGDEHDYIENEFKLRSFTTGGEYRGDMGMGIWKVYNKSVSGGREYYRHKFVSSFTDVCLGDYNIPLMTVSDDDILIERFIDYLRGDFDHDGILEISQGEIEDFDGDGNLPYDPDTGFFDEDDWGYINHYEDNIRSINTGVPGGDYMLFDAELDNHVDIDIDTKFFQHDWDPAYLEVDGTDLDNEGLFDGIDVNDDGDMDDWVSIDEQISLYGSGPDIRDDELAEYLSVLNVGRMIVFMEPCFGGGFIWDLSDPKRVIMTATTEEASSYGNVFVRGFTSAFHGADTYGNPVNADYDGDGNVSMVEAFNYASKSDDSPEIPQYDDNGDGISHSYPIPNGSDGTLGCKTCLYGFEKGPFPFEPSSPDPPDGFMYCVNGLNPNWLTVLLSWNGGDPNEDDVVNYDIYFGQESDDLQYLDTVGPYPATQKQIGPYNLGVIDKTGTCYWKIVARDNHGNEVEGPTWYFIICICYPPSPQQFHKVVLSSQPGSQQSSRLTTNSLAFFENSLYNT